MKLFIFILALLQSSFSLSQIKTLDIAVEMKTLKFEYYDVSERGVVTVYGCSYCQKKTYEFTKKPKITKNGKPVSLEYFLKDFRNAKYPTLLLHKTELSILEIIY